MKSTTVKNQYPLGRRARVISAIVAIALFGVEATQGEAASTSPGGTYQGVTSQGLPGYIKVSGSGRTITRASITLQVNCSLGDSFAIPQAPHGLTVTPGGRFKGALEDQVVEEGIQFQVYLAFSGQFNRSRTSVTSNSRVRITARFPDGVTDTCDSGMVTLRAHK